MNTIASRRRQFFPKRHDHDYGLILWDAFTDSDATLIENHTPNRAPIGAVWSQDDGKLDIQSNKLTLNEAHAARYASIDTGYLGNYRLQCVMHSGTAGGIIGNHFMLRYIDSDNWWQVYAGDAGFLIKEKTAGTLTTRATGTTFMTSDTDYTVVITDYYDTISVNFGGNLLSYSSSVHKGTGSIIRVGLTCATSITVAPTCDDLKIFKITDNPS